MAVLNDPAGATYSELNDRLDPQGPASPADRTAWVSQALRARERALRLLQSRVDRDVETGAGEGRDKGIYKSVAALTEEYLEESEKLFELTSSLIRSQQKP
jgi:hypothetical protein